MATFEEALTHMRKGGVAFITDNPELGYKIKDFDFYENDDDEWHHVLIRNYMLFEDWTLIKKEAQK